MSTIKYGGGTNPPVRLDKWQNIVGVGWGGEPDEYLALQYIIDGMTYLANTSSGEVTACSVEYNESPTGPKGGWIVYEPGTLNVRVQPTKTPVRTEIEIGAFATVFFLMGSFWNFGGSEEGEREVLSSVTHEEWDFASASLFAYGGQEEENSDDDPSDAPPELDGDPVPVPFAAGQFFEPGKLVRFDMLGPAKTQGPACVATQFTIDEETTSFVFQGYGAAYPPQPTTEEELLAVSTVMQSHVFDYSGMTLTRDGGTYQAVAAHLSGEDGLSASTEIETTSTTSTLRARRSVYVLFKRIGDAEESA
jgi:hypothetical protein